MAYFSQLVKPFFAEHYVCAKAACFAHTKESRKESKMKIKRMFAFLQAVLLLCMVCGGLWVTAEEGDPSAHPVGEDHLFWVTHYNDGTVEGAGSVFTEEDTAGGWWIHVAFAPTETAEVYEIAAITNGLADGSATPVEVPEGGFVWAANYGNDYASMESGGTDYTSENCASAIEYAKTWTVGQRYTVHGVDLATVPTSTPELKWYDPLYLCTSTIAPYNTDPVAALHAKLKALVGEDAEGAVFAWEMAAETDTQGVATVTLTIKELASPTNLQNVYGHLVYDHEAMTLLTEVNEQENLLDCVTSLPSEKWENMCCIYKDDRLNVIPGELDMGAVNASDDSVISEETPLVLTLRFKLNEGYDLGGLYIPTETVYGNDNEMDTLAGNGAYAVLQRATPPEASDRPSEDSTPPQSGDKGVVWFALLGSVAMVGLLAAWKTRRAEA